jgi:capsular polysaccharide biosynthesis protein
MRDLAPGDVFRTLSSPGFLMPPPVVRHPHRVPRQIRRAMDVAQGQHWFRARPVRIAVLEDVFVTAEGLVLTSELDIVAPSVEQHLSHDIDSARAAVQAGAAQAGAVPRLHGDVVLCRKPGTQNYGHWLVEMLPRAWLAAQHWPGVARIMVQVAAEPLRTVMRDSLARLGISPDLLVEGGRAPLRVDRLILVDGLSQHGTYLSPFVTECLAAIAAGVPPAGPDRLVVARNTASRSLVDEPGFHLRASRAGYGILDPAALPFVAQIAAFKAAGRIVGAMGAAMTNLAFAEAGAEAIILAPAGMPDTLFWFLAGLRGLHSTEIRCEPAPPWIGPNPWDTRLRLDPADEAWILAASATPRSAGALFDPSYYRARYPDIAEAGTDPLEHYMEHGWQEGRRPSPWFDPDFYLRTNPDVAEARVNPLLHYVLHGRQEGRTPSEQR